MYEIKTQQFEGPFNLLLELITKKELSINKISLAEVADQYINYIKELEKFPKKETSAFVVTAATLILIKSRSLIPSFEITPEEEDSIAELEKKLKIYECFHAAAKKIEKIFGKNIIFLRDNSIIEKPIFVIPKDLSLDKLKKELTEMLKATQSEIKRLPRTKVTKIVTLEEKINDLIERLQKKASFCFSEIKTNPNCAKIDLIVSFLALLELAKRGLIIIRQERNFEDMEISKK